MATERQERQNMSAAQWSDDDEDAVAAGNKSDLHIGNLCRE